MLFSLNLMVAIFMQSSLERKANCIRLLCCCVQILKKSNLKEERFIYRGFGLFLLGFMYLGRMSWQRCASSSHSAQVLWGREKERERGKEREREKRERERERDPPPKRDQAT
jgi:hypothetical protein